MNAEKLIELLSLEPLSEEGGFFRETYRSRCYLEKGGEKRTLATAIYYLLKEGEVSRLHRLRSDETWHFYLGDPVELFVFKEDGSGGKILLGNDIELGELPQFTVPAGSVQGARLKNGGKFALMGTTVYPGFDPKDFDLCGRDEMIAAYPAHQEIINSLT